MSNNARAATTDGGEIGVSQYVQARAAGVAPSTDHNPVLLKPRGDGESQPFGRRCGRTRGARRLRRALGGRA